MKIKCVKAEGWGGGMKPKDMRSLFRDFYPLIT